MKILPVEEKYVLGFLAHLLRTPSPTGYTDRAVHVICDELEAFNISYEITRRGAIRAELPGKQKAPDRALVSHVDTLGAMVKSLKTNGRLAIVPIGHWNARFAEGARCSIFTDYLLHRGTILPLKASGHAFGEEVDSQPCSWDNLEVRVDDICFDEKDLMRLGFHVGDFIAIDTNTEILENGFINSRHLDDKAGVAIMMGVAKSIINNQIELPVDCYLLFTISEEVGSGASAVLHQDVAEMVTIDNGVTAPGQNSSEFGVTLAMSDLSGPFDYHLTHRLIQICHEFNIPHQRDVFRYYRSDSAAAVEAGNDLRTSLVCFGIDASHGYERIHWKSLESLIQLLSLYLQSPPLFGRDRYDIGPREGFPTMRG